MMNKIKFLMGLVVGLCIVNIGLMAFILFRPPVMHDERPRELIIQKLNFDKEQVAQYDKMISAHRDSVHSLERQIHDAKNQLYGSLVRGTLKDSLMSKLGELQQRIEMVHYNHFMDIKKLCRAGQQQQFNELTTELADYFRPPPPKR